MNTPNQPREVFRVDNFCVIYDTKYGIRVLPVRRDPFGTSYLGDEDDVTSSQRAHMINSAFHHLLSKSTETEGDRSTNAAVMLALVDICGGSVTIPAEQIENATGQLVYRFDDAGNMEIARMVEQ